MPKKARELSATEVRRLTREGLHAVGGVAGLLLQVTATGARSWILRVTVGNRRRDIGLGGFPDVPLTQARDKAREARELIRQGVDPIEQRQAARNALMAAQAKYITFDECARQYITAKSAEFQNAKHRAQWSSTLATYASPFIGKLPVNAVELAHVVKVLEPIWHEKTETASRVRGRIESVLAWATVSGYRQGDNPARWRGNLELALPRPSRITKVKHHAALPYQEVPGFMIGLRNQNGLGARALEFAILTAARSGEVRGATWDEIDIAAKLWTIPADRMKAGKPHRVPLSPASIALLKAQPRIEGSPHVFTAPRGGMLSDMTLSKVLRSMKVDATVHGFRSSFKDWARTSTSYADEISELALAHVNSDQTRAAYARDELLSQRAKLMTEWSRYLSSPRASSSGVIPMARAML